MFIKGYLYLIFKYFYRLSLKAYNFRFFFPRVPKCWFVKRIFRNYIQSYPNSDYAISVYAIKKRTFRDPNSRPGETDPYEYVWKCVYECGQQTKDWCLKTVGAEESLNIGNLNILNSCKIRQEFIPLTSNLESEGDWCLHF